MMVYIYHQKLVLMKLFITLWISVAEFSKKTGDYPSLSSTDIKVIALTYELHKQHVGADSINTEPIVRQISYINHSVLTDKEVLAGFYTPSKVHWFVFVTNLVIMYYATVIKRLFSLRQLKQ